LLLFATSEMIEAPLNRLFVYFVFHGQVPVPAGMPSSPPPLSSGGFNPITLIPEAVFFRFPMIRDWRTRGRVHPAYLVAVRKSFSESKMSSSSAAE
jgi:hypothetical protein